MSIIEDDENSGEREREQFMYLTLHGPFLAIELFVLSSLRFSKHTLWHCIESLRLSPFATS